MAKRVGAEACAAARANEARAGQPGPEGRLRDLLACDPAYAVLRANVSVRGGGVRGLGSRAAKRGAGLSASGGVLASSRLRNLKRAGVSNRTVASTSMRTAPWK